jgi:SAM-dependent methyltransferase
MLAESARGLAAMKHYMAVAHSLRRPRSPILDLGCGAGHELSVLEAVGVAAIGVDSSETMLVAAQDRVQSPLVQGDGAFLPFRDGAFGGCWIERVLMHVVDPAAVIREAVRCIAPGALLTVFEPDWTSLIVNGHPVPPAIATMARHPAAGAVAGDLLEDAGCFLRDRVEERSWWTFDTFARVMNLERVRTDPVVGPWVVAQQKRADAGDFRAQFTKVLWVATAPE